MACGVALRKESVDRNYQANAVDQILPGVALRKESVDRNNLLNFLQCHVCVALRKESVDRNNTARRRLDATGKSLSARRAWIEIFWGTAVIAFLSWSLSARRAWIEIYLGRARHRQNVWSLSARRAWIEIT